MRKIDESSNYNILRTITDNILISYLKQHKDECPEVIYKLKELVSTHCIKEVREASLETLIAVGQPDTDSLTHYITDYIPKDSDCATQRENKRTQYFLDKLSDQSDCILLTLRGTNLIQYLSIYKNHCPDLVDRIKELLKTNRRKKIRVAAYDVLERLQIEQIEDFKKYIQKPNIVEQTGTKPNRTNPLNKEKAIVLYMMLAKKYKDCRSKIKCGVFMNMWKEKFECDKYNISKDGRQKLREMQIAAFAFVKDELDSKTYDEIKEFRDTFQIYSSREIPVELKRLAQSKDVVVELAKDTEKHLSGFNVLVKEKKGVPFAINPLPFGLSEKGVLKLLNSLPTRSEIKEKEKNLTNTLLSESTKVAHKKSAVNAYKAPYATHEFKKFMSNFTIKNCTNKELTLFCVNLCQRVGINNMSNDLPIKYEFCVGSGKRNRSMKRAKARKRVMQRQLRKTKEHNLLAYGRVYINNLKSKATSIFNELIANNELTQANFINEFKRKYPKDYDMLQYEWEFKVHEFKKNRKDAQKPHPIRPEKILSNMYKNYYFKIIKKPIIDEHKEKELSKMRGLIGEYGYKIKRNDAGMYNIINKSSKDIEYHNLDFKTLKQTFKQITTN